MYPTQKRQPRQCPRNPWAKLGRAFEKAAEREKIYQFIGVYTGGQQDENGRLLCEYWEVAIG